MTTALEGGKRSESRPGRALPQGKTRYPLYRRLFGPQSRSEEVRKISPPPGFVPRIVQPVASRYTDYATRPTKSNRLSWVEMWHRNENFKLKFWSRKSYFGYLGVNGRIILNWIPKAYIWQNGLDLIFLGWGLFLGCTEHGKEPSGSLR